MDVEPNGKILRGFVNVKVGQDTGRPDDFAGILQYSVLEAEDYWEVRASLWLGRGKNQQKVLHKEFSGATKLDAVHKMWDTINTIIG